MHTCSYTMHWHAASHLAWVSKTNDLVLKQCTEEVMGSDTTWVMLDTFSSTSSRLHDHRISGSSETIPVVETKELAGVDWSTICLSVSP